MDIGAFCLIFVLSGQHPIITYDYKDEDACLEGQKAIMASHPTAQSWCVPWLRDETKKTRAKWKVVE